MMENDLKKITEQELLEKKKKAKSNQIISAVLIGVLIGIAAYSTYKNGLGFFTFLPLVFVFLLVKSTSHLKNIEQELKNRNQ